MSRRKWFLDHHNVRLECQTFFEFVKLERQGHYQLYIAAVIYVILLRCLSYLRWTKLYDCLQRPLHQRLLKIFVTILITTVIKYCNAMKKRYPISVEPPTVSILCMNEYWTIFCHHGSTDCGWWVDLKDNSSSCDIK